MPRPRRPAQAAGGTTDRARRRRRRCRTGCRWRQPPPAGRTLQVCTRFSALPPSAESTGPGDFLDRYLPAWGTHTPRSHPNTTPREHPRYPAPAPDLHAPRKRHRPAALHHGAVASGQRPADGSPDHLLSDQRERALPRGFPTSSPESRLAVVRVRWSWCAELPMAWEIPSRIRAD
jgi:hypothetical protein